MPKLASDQARAAETAHEEGPKTGGPMVPEGIYLGQLKEVSVSDKEGDSGYRWWNWDFTLQDEGYKGNEKRFITSLAPQAEFAIGGAFAAFHVPADTDTDELLGQFAMLHISQVPITKGSRKGELQNRIERITAVDPDGEAELAKAGFGGDARSEDF